MTAVDFTITGEYENKRVEFSGRELEALLSRTLTFSSSASDFRNKVTLSVTDKTSLLSQKDNQNLINYFHKFD